MEQTKVSVIKKQKPKKIKPELILVEEVSPKNITIRTISKKCKKGTKKYKPLGPGCFTQEDINNYKLTKNIDRKKKKKTKKVIELEILEGNPLEIIEEKRIEIDLIQKDKLNKRRLKTPVELEIMEKRYNEEFIELMEKLNNIMLKQGEPFRARAYQKAQETIMTYQDDIFEPKQLKGLPSIGPTIMDKLNEYVETGTLRILEREKTNPINILSDIYGVGPKKAQELVDAGVKTIDELRVRQNDLLNDIQKVGLIYYEQIQQRIPRVEIEEYEKIFKSIFVELAKESPDAKFEIVGSYRRGAQTSGDIDIIITGETGVIYKAFVDELIKTGIILEILSRGQSKTLVIAKLPGEKDHIARRVDFLYAPPDEFAFAILYFTGSKIFNTVMRQYGLDKGYTFNEHGIYKLENKKKGQKVVREFRIEKDIFDFLGLQFKTPIERIDGRAVIPYTVVGSYIGEIAENLPTSMKAEKETIEITPTKKNKTLKIKKTKPVTKIAQDLIIAESDDDAISNINDFKLNGIVVLEHLNEKELTDIIRYANKQYYNDVPSMSDNQYDIIKDFIMDKFPDNDIATEIGAEVERNKVRLPYEMASMDKIKPDTTALINWMDKYKGPYMLSCKLDGVSGLYTTEGDKPKLYTRGNGKVGQDISHLIPFIRLPKTKGIVIRGEFIIPKSVFEEKYKTTFANPRNMVAGIINHKHISEAIIDVHFVAYEVIMPQMKPIKQMNFISTLNVERVLFEITDSLSNDFLSELLVEWRKSYIYEIDGIIVTNDNIYPRKSGNPEHAFAFKMVLSDQIAEAKVVDVIWTPSKDGYLKPRVRIEPINLGGVKIEYATGFNAAFIKDNLIGIGSIIQLIRSGDVIPHIKAVTVPAEQPKMPTVPFKWNDTHVDIMLENASEDPTVKEKNITGFFRGIGVEGLSSGNIARLIKAGYDTVAEIIKMEEKDFLNVEGFKGKLANKIYTGIHSKLEEASIITLMAASNIFGRGFSEKRMTLVLEEIPDVLISDESNNEKIADIASVKGMAVKTAEAFVEKIDDFKDFLEECGLTDKLYEEKKAKTVNNSHPLFGKTVVLTGTRDQTIIDYLKLVGANQGTTVSKNTFLVIAKNKDDDTGKAEEARKLNVPIVSVTEFIEMNVNK
jgi:NAD-dependent DNA ligase/DNA polymerase/3'-5' exonuclease PolX